MGRATPSSRRWRSGCGIAASPASGCPASPTPTRRRSSPSSGRAFAAVGLPEYTPHSFRKTLAMLGDKLCETMEQRKAWSQNLGHEHLATTVSAYMPVSRERQAELLLEMGGERSFGPTGPTPLRSSSPET